MEKIEKKVFGQSKYEQTLNPKIFNCATVIRYFPDFFVRVKNRHGVQEAMILEVKPLKQAVPPQVKKRITRQYIQEVATYGINEAKWKAATEYCKDRNWSFKVITEKDLGI